MNLSANQPHNLPLKPLHTTTLFLSNGTSSIHLRQFTVYRKRRRFKKLTVKSHLKYSFENLFNNLLSQFPSPNSVDLLAPALGLFSGFALYFSQSNSDKLSRTSSCVGNWILFTSPTPFNRFVVLRCPSISFKESDLLEDVSEKLVKEDRHFVRLNSGRILVNSGGGDETERNLEYQRRCVSTEDGGVISLDWPANLDLGEEHGLDTTLLLVPGTAEGSMEKSIKLFVCEALEHGIFPVVMNPRGCGGSPLTSAR